MAAAGAKTFTHLQRVRLLYKTVLRLHRGLPLEFKAIGDQYVKEEFKRHKNCKPEEVSAFMTAWVVSQTLFGPRSFRKIKSEINPPVTSNKKNLVPSTLQLLPCLIVKTPCRRAQHTQTIFVPPQDYAVTLTKQLSVKHIQRGDVELGRDLTPTELDLFRDEQISQLYELMQESTKPIVESEDAPPH